jgi:hypothetical protein
MTDSDSGLRGCRQLPPFRSVRRGLGLDGLRLRKPRWSRKWADADVGFLKVPDNFYIFEKIIGCSQFLTNIYLSQFCWRETAKHVLEFFFRTSLNRDKFYMNMI